MKTKINTKFEFNDIKYVGKIYERRDTIGASTFQTKKLIRIVNLSRKCTQVCVIALSNNVAVNDKSFTYNNKPWHVYELFTLSI